MTEDEIVGWHHQLNGHDFYLALGDGEGQGKAGMLQFMGSKQSDETERLNNNMCSLLLPSIVIWNLSGLF